MRVNDFTVRIVAVGHLNIVAAELQHLNLKGALKLNSKENELYDERGSNGHLAVLPVSHRIYLHGRVEWALRQIKNRKANA